MRALLTEAAVELPITVRRIDSDAEAKAERFLGSPTIRVNGVDVDPTAVPRDTYGAWILAALQRQPPGGRAG